MCISEKGGGGGGERSFITHESGDNDQIQYVELSTLRLRILRNAIRGGRRAESLRLHLSTCDDWNFTAYGHTVIPPYFPSIRSLRPPQNPLKKRKLCTKKKILSNVNDPLPLVFPRSTGKSAFQTQQNQNRHIHCTDPVFLHRIPILLFLFFPLSPHFTRREYPHFLCKLLNPHISFHSHNPTFHT